MNKFCVAALCAASVAGSSLGAIRITEWMYNGAGGTNREFFEITNVGGPAVDLTGWSFDDNSRTPGSLSLSSLGTLAAGESAIVCEQASATFRTAWSLGAAVKILGSSTQNLGRADEINIYDAGNNLVDRLTYDDQTLGGHRTQGISDNIKFSKRGLNDSSSGVASVAGDSWGSITSASGDVGNPGTYADVPAPGALALAGLGAILARRKR